MTGPSEAMKAAFPPMTNEELADGDYADIVDALANEPANGLQEPERVLLHAAADALRAMPEGERIEGCEIGSAFLIDDDGGDSVTVKLPPGGSLHKMLLEPCTLTIHTRKEGESNE